MGTQIQLKTSKIFVQIIRNLVCHKVKKTSRFLKMFFLLFGMP